MQRVRLPKLRKLDLFIIGAAKSGTSSLYDKLCESENVAGALRSIDKEPAFFSPAKRGNLTLDEYHSKYDLDTEAKYVVDGSTCYISDIFSPKLIFDYNADAKIIAILRDPVSRAVSLYDYMVKEGYELRSFNKAVLEDERNNKTIKQSFLFPEYEGNYQYLRSGLYEEQITRYIDLFGHNFRFITYENLLGNTEYVLSSIENWLDIKLNDYQLPHSNPGRLVLNRYLAFLARIIQNKMNLQKKFESKADRDWLIRRTYMNHKHIGQSRYEHIMKHLPADYYAAEKEILKGSKYLEYNLSILNEV